MNWLKKAQQGLDLNEDIDQAGADVITPEVDYEQLAAAVPELQEIVNWLTQMKEAAKHIPVAEQRLEQILQENGISNVNQIPELSQLFNS